jgi:branched-subunit amino acid ABC-type transport system permease component
MQTGFALGIFINGLSLSSTYALMAIGLTLVFGVLRVLNFAHGELLMVGAFTTWVVFAVLDFPFPVALIAATFLVAGIALAIDRILLRRTRQDPFRGFIILLALLYILQVAALLIFGGQGKSVPVGIPGQIELLGSSLSIQRIILVLVTFSVIGGVWTFLERTKFGRAVRASIQDPEAASLQGIRLNTMCAIVMAIAGALAGLGGGIISQTFAVSPYFGTAIIIKAFIVVIVGGMGSVGGTMVGSFLFGFLDSSVSSLVNPRITILLDVVVLLIILAFRPRGLFGRE